MRPSVRICITLTFLFCSVFALAQMRLGQVIQKIDNQVLELMVEGDIPGISLIVVSGGETMIRNYGYSDLNNKTKVSENTLFQLGSCSKAFTSMVVMQLVEQGRLDLDAPVSNYLPWFTTQYQSVPIKMTVRQLLHHTSGIPWKTISKIKPSNSEDALEQTVRNLVGQSLNHSPGEKYEYATVNYDILALIVQKVVGRPFEEVVKENVVDRLQMQKTTIGAVADSSLMSKGYKIGFFSARDYTAPIYKGNNAAGYVISNATDIAIWLRFQMGIGHTELYSTAKLTHQRDETVPLHDMSAYAMGWEVSLDGSGEIYHGGLNPNYTSYISFREKNEIGVAILANSNSSMTPIIANNVMKILAGKALPKEFESGDALDKVFSIVSIFLLVYLLIALAFLVSVISDIVRRKRQYTGFCKSKLLKSFGVLLIFVPFLLGLYLLPMAMAEFSWESIVVWTPISCLVAIKLILISMSLSFFIYLFGLAFPERDKIKSVAPQLLIVSILAGLANTVVIILITSSIGSDIELKYLLFYYVLTASVYLLGRRYVQTCLTRLSKDLTFDLRIKLLDKIFSTSYQKFEKIDRGKVYTALNDDVSTIGDSANTFIMLATSLITATGAFLYLATIAFWATILTIMLVVSIGTLYYFVGKSTDKYFQQARDSRNVFMNLINGLIDGFKEISIRINKKLAYRADVVVAADEYRTKITSATIRFVDAFLVGESLLIILLGAVTFAIPQLFPSIQLQTLLSFILVLLYLIGPIDSLLGSVPALMQFKIAWNRIQQFREEIPANLDLHAAPEKLDKCVESFKAIGIEFQYENKNDQEMFVVGPIDVEVKRGEILFIIGGNGSGKTTLAKLFSGLYEPSAGSLMINDNVVKSSQLSEYFSPVFSPHYLFEKLYDIPLVGRENDVNKYLRVINLHEKVTIAGNKYSTIDLSGGQRKRLALLQCYLEDSPIYLFDEWAADQDPGYRNLFYRYLLPEMKAAGKIIIAITHDDQYFDVADKVLKMREGKMEQYAQEYLVGAIVR